MCACVRACVQASRQIGWVEGRGKEVIFYKQMLRTSTVGSGAYTSIYTYREKRFVCGVL